MSEINVEFGDSNPINVELVQDSPVNVEFGDSADINVEFGDSADINVSFGDSSPINVVFEGVPDITWENLVMRPTEAPTLNTTITGGSVYNYIFGSTTYYRFIPDPYDYTLDRFYSTFTDPTLSGLVATRGRAI